MKGSAGDRNGQEHLRCPSRTLLPASAPNATHAALLDAPRTPLASRVPCSSSSRSRIYTETTDEDTKRCLKKYEKVTGNKLDWSAWDRRQNTFNHGSPHASCETFFKGHEAAANKTMHYDREVAKAFGYGNKCCGRAAHPI